MGEVKNFTPQVHEPSFAMKRESINDVTVGKSHRVALLNIVSTIIDGWNDFFHEENSEAADQLRWYKVGHCEEGRTTQSHASPSSHRRLSTTMSKCLSHS